MISNLPSYRHEQRVPFGKEGSPRWNSLWISTAARLCRSQAERPRAPAASVCWVRLPSCASAWQLHVPCPLDRWEKMDISQDRTHRWAQYPHNPRTTGGSLCDDIPQYCRKHRRLSSGVLLEETASLLGLRYWESVVTGTSFLTFHYLQQHLPSS